MSLIGFGRPGWADQEGSLAAAEVRNIRVDDPHIIAEGALIPGLIDTPNGGPFVELVRRLGAAISAHPIEIRVTSRLRLIRDVSQFEIDWGFPMARGPMPATAPIGFRLSTASIGQVSFVIYSRPDNVLTANAIQSASSERDFPYKIIGPDILGLPFPVLPLRNYDSAVRMLLAGRCEGLVAPQEDVEYTLRSLNISDIHRSFYKLYEDVFMLPLGPRGDFVDGLLTKAVDRLRCSGELQRLYQHVRRPYQGPP